MAVKITDVARHAGVSMKTVSRVLNGERNVTEATRLKVQASVDALKYRPNLAARGLAGARSYLLALLYDNPSADYITQLQRGASQACRQRGFHLMIEPFDLSGGDPVADMDGLLERLPVDGVILTPPLFNSKRIMGVLDAVGTPYVLIAAGQEVKAPIVAIDDAQAAYEMTCYLLEVGHRDIGFVKGHPRHTASQLRYNGYVRALDEAGISVKSHYIYQGDYSFTSGTRCAEQVFNAASRPTALFASNDAMATAIIAYARRQGLSVPEDISICGFDDMAQSSYVWPPLTTVRQPIQQMGAKAAQILMNKPADVKKDMQAYMFAHELVIRESVAPFKVK